MIKSKQNGRCSPWASTVIFLFPSKIPTNKILVPVQLKVKMLNYFNYNLAIIAIMFKRMLILK